MFDQTGPLVKLKGAVETFSYDLTAASRLV